MIKSGVILISIGVSILLFSCGEKKNPETIGKSSESEIDKIVEKRYVSKEEFEKLISQQMDVELETKNQKTSYAIGQQTGASYKRDSLNLEIAQYIAGFYDGFMKIPNQISNQEIRQLYGEHLIAQSKAQDEKFNNMEEKKEEERKRFPILSPEVLEKNKLKPNVKVSDSGLQYTITVMGNNKKVDNNTVAKTNAVIWNIDSSFVLDTYSTGELLYLNYSYFPPGFTEAVNLVGEGGVIDVLIPTELAFYKQGLDLNPRSPLSPSVPPNSAVYAQLKVEEIMTIEEARAEGAYLPEEKDANKK